MWRILLTVSLLCWSADGEDVTCRDHNNGAVDWYIIYKAPKLNNIGTTGLEYIYIDSTGKKKETLTTDLTYKPINHPNGVLANTLRPIFTTSMTDNFGFISYSDQAPGCHADDKFGHSKGVVMMDKTKGDKTGVWLSHSVPRFPFLRDQNKFYPPSGAAKAQTFICVTFKYEEFKKIGQHLLDINAFTFDDHIPEGFYTELKALRRTENNIRALRENKVKIQSLISAGLPSTGLPSTGLPSTGLPSAGRTSFESIAKKQYKAGEEAEDDECDYEPPTKKPRTGPPPTTKEPKDEYDGDLYLTIAEKYNTDVKVQTWCGRNEGCYSGGPQVFKITKLGKEEVMWDFGNDHSKWCVAEAKTNDLICIADVNRGLKQYKRPGGALCFKHREASKLFQDVIAKTKECR